MVQKAARNWNLLQKCHQLEHSQNNTVFTVFLEQIPLKRPMWLIHRTDPIDSKSGYKSLLNFSQQVRDYMQTRREDVSGVEAQADQNLLVWTFATKRQMQLLIKETDSTKCK